MALPWQRHPRQTRCRPRKCQVRRPQFLERRNAIPVDRAANLASKSAEFEADKVAHFGVTFTYFHQSIGNSQEVVAIEQNGERFEQSHPGSIGGIYLLRSGLLREPATNDEVQVPSGRKLKPGYYRVADVIISSGQGRLLLLQYLRK